MRIIKTYIVVFVTLSVFVFPSQSQEITYTKPDSPIITGSYFGQKPPGATPEIFAPGIISTDEFEFAITFSCDKSDIFFTRRPTYEGGGNSIMHANFSDDKLSIPSLAPFAKNGYIELAPYCAPDELKVYFHSERENPITGKKMVNDEKIWFSVKTGKGWSEAKYLQGVINSGWVMGIAPANNYNLFLCGEVNKLSGILRSEIQKQTYAEIEKILDGVHPFIAPDESYIIFDSIGKNWEESYLCICFKKPDGNWGKPIMLPETVNATKTESFGRISPDGKYFFFQRKGDIYWVDFEIMTKSLNITIDN